MRSSSEEPLEGETPNNAEPGMLQQRCDCYILLSIMGISPHLKGVQGGSSPTVSLVNFGDNHLRADRFSTVIRMVNAWGQGNGIVFHISIFYF